MTENQNNPETVDAIEPEINIKDGTTHHRLRRRSDHFARQRRKDTKVIKAYKASEEGALEKAANSAADYVMIDSGAGSGKKFDWSILKDFKRDYFLAGGLDPESVGEAIRMLEPFAVDVSSGVETDGIKDEKKIAEFIKAVKYGGKNA